MNTNHVSEHLLAYVSDDLDDYRKRTVEQHLSACPECKNELVSLQQVWTDLGTLPEQQPSESLRARVYGMIDTFERGKNQMRTQGASPWKYFFQFKNPAIQFGLAAALLLVGGLAGYQLRVERSNQNQLSQLQHQVKDMNRLLTISLLQQTSASERLRGVSLSYGPGSADPEVISALLHALKYDANVNVRLAALDALSDEVSQQKVQDEIVKALPKQNSPLVQIAIIDLLLQSHSREVAGILRQMLQDPKTNINVKEHIQKNIQAVS